MTRSIVRRPGAWLLCAAVAGVVTWATSGHAVAQDKKKAEVSGGESVKLKRAEQAPTQGRPVKKPTQARRAQKAPELHGPPRPGSRSIKVQPAGKGHEGHRHGPATGQKGGRGAPKPTVVLKPGEVPAIKFDVPTYDFGRVRAGQDVLHDFWFTNTGTGPLEILRVKPG